MKKYISVMLALISTTMCFQTTIAGNLNTAKPVIESRYIVNSDIPDVTLVTPSNLSDKALIYKDRTYIPLNVFRELEIEGFGKAKEVIHSQYVVNNQTHLSININWEGIDSSDYLEFIITDTEIKSSTFKNGDISVHSIDISDKDLYIINKNGYNYIPISILRDMLGLSVQWEKDIKTVTITGKFEEVPTDIVEPVPEVQLPTQKPEKIKLPTETEVPALGYTTTNELDQLLIDILRSADNKENLTENQSKECINKLKTKFKSLSGESISELNMDIGKSTLSALYYAVTNVVTETNSKQSLSELLSKIKMIMIYGTMLNNIDKVTDIDIQDIYNNLCGDSNDVIKEHLRQVKEQVPDLTINETKINQIISNYREAYKKDKKVATVNLLINMLNAFAE